MNTQRLRIGFQWISPELWTGGLTYLKNLFIAVRTFPIEQIDNVLMVESLPLKESYRREFDPLVAAYCAPPLLAGHRRWSCGWWAHHCCQIGGKLNPYPGMVFDKFCVRNQIDVVFQRNAIPHARVPQLVWIPDFQHIYLPEMFSDAERTSRDVQFASIARFATRVVLSSNDAKKDFIRLFPDAAAKAHVVQFVAHVPENCRPTDLGAVLRQYNLPEKFFFLPNQFWRHKNHEVVFRAISILKEKGQSVTVVCTGLPFDFRTPAYAADLLRLLSTLNIRENVIILGLVPQADLYSLIRQSVAVLNPSRFEGWSTTVEECKSIGKSLILSDLAVHKEQSPPASTYFPVDDAAQLAALLKTKWDGTPPGPDSILEDQARTDLPRRQQAFAANFVSLCQAACS